jgi:dethiobiotin synthetase/adenosylmethionine--8-amino-7-oxononanoate aminotransferase
VRCFPPCSTVDQLTDGTIKTNTGYRSHSAKAMLKSLGDAVGGTSQGVTSAPGGAPFSIHFRTLGDVAYFITSLNTPPATIRAVEDRVWSLLNR